VILRPRHLPILLALACLPQAAYAKEGATDGVRRVEVTAARLKLGDFVAGLGELGETDLGPSPAPGVTRLLTRDDIASTLESQAIQGVRGIPDAVRVSRKLEVLNPEKLRLLAADAIEASGLRPGVELKSVQLPALVKIASGWDKVTATVPKPPRRPGSWSATVVLAFEAEGQRLARVAVPAIFDVSPAAAMPDASKGDALTLVVKSGLVEVSTRGTAGDNADVGDTLPVTIRTSGKVVRARLVARDRAVLEGSTP